MSSPINTLQYTVIEAGGLQEQPLNKDGGRPTTTAHTGDDMVEVVEVGGYGWSRPKAVPRRPVDAGHVLDIWIRGGSPSRCRVRLGDP